MIVYEWWNKRMEERILKSKKEKEKNEDENINKIEISFENEDKNESESENKNFIKRLIISLVSFALFFTIVGSIYVNLKNNENKEIKEKIESSLNELTEQEESLPGKAVLSIYNFDKTENKQNNNDKNINFDFVCSNILLLTNKVNFYETDSGEYLPSKFNEESKEKRYTYLSRYEFNTFNEKKINFLIKSSYKNDKKEFYNDCLNSLEELKNNKFEFSYSSIENNKKKTITQNLNDAAFDFKQVFEFYDFDRDRDFYGKDTEYESLKKDNIEEDKDLENIELNFVKKEKIISSTDKETMFIIYFSLDGNSSVFNYNVDEDFFNEISSETKINLRYKSDLNHKVFEKIKEDEINKSKKIYTGKVAIQKNEENKYDKDYSAFIYFYEKGTNELIDFQKELDVIHENSFNILKEFKKLSIPEKNNFLIERGLIKGNDEGDYYYNSSYELEVIN